ncbi:MAG: 50S ribosomal protein L35 [Phycisphaerales bacterium]|nr:50S ribosomal protein L35 [Phycisphaerales bacterium]
MPKMKVHKGLKKRFRLTATKKVRFKASFTGHLMSGKSGNRVRGLRKPQLVQGPTAYKIRIMLGS